MTKQARITEARAGRRISGEVVLRYRAHASNIGRKVNPRGRDIALRCPRPRSLGGTRSRDARIAPLDAAQTAQRAVPTPWVKCACPVLHRIHACALLLA